MLAVLGYILIAIITTVASIYVRVKFFGQNYSVYAVKNTAVVSLIVGVFWIITVPVMFVVYSVFGIIRGLEEVVKRI